METLLFINACMRGPELSNTYKLCRIFLDEYAAANPESKLEEVDLTKEMMPYYDNAAIKARDKLIDAGKTDHEMFHLARQFAQADKILIGAPYWDMSFPTALKSYVEHISARNITFALEPTSIKGLCRAKKLIYITTAAGYIMPADCGAQYFKHLCVQFGIEQFADIYADGLEIQGQNPDAIMRTAGEKVAAVASIF